MTSHSVERSLSELTTVKVMKYALGIVAEIAS